MKTKNKILLIVLYVILFSVIYHEWIFSKSILTYGDWYYFFNESLSSTRLSYFNLWVSDFNLGSIVIGAGQAVSWGAYGVLVNLFHTNYQTGLRIVHLFPIIIFTPLSSFLLIKKITKSKISSIIGSFIYSFNTYFLLLDTGHLTLLGAYAFAPLAIYLYMSTLATKKLYPAVLSALVLSICSLYEPRIAYIILFILFFYFLFFLFIIEKKRNIRSLGRLAWYGGLPVVMYLLLNAYWILGLSRTGSISSNEIFSRMLFGNEFLNISNAFTLFHPFWTGATPTIFEIQQIPLYFWLIPYLAFCGLIVGRKNKDIVFFGFVSLLGILLTKQAGIPFADLYKWLFLHFPGFNAFREASKFFFLIALGYSVLIAAFVNWLWKNWKKNKWQVYGKYFLTVFIATLFIWNTKPLITGEFGTMFTPRHVPEDYLIFNKNIFSSSDYFRVLWAPIFSRWSMVTLMHPQLGLVNMESQEWKKFMSSPPAGENVTEAQLMMEPLFVPGAKTLLDASSIKYVVVPLEDKVNDDDFFVYYGKPRQYYINQLNKLSYLKKINVGTKDIVVYENEGYRPHIYLSSGSLVLDGRYSDNSFPRSNTQNPTSNYQFISPTEYKVTISNIKNPVYLQFAESYHPDWKLRVGEFHWWEVLLDKNYFLPASIHSKNDAQLNQYLINPDVVCKVHKVSKVYKDGCKMNEDGSYDIDMTLYFAPQSYMYLGGIISLTTLLGIIGYLGYVGVRAINNNQRAKKSDKRR